MSFKFKSLQLLDNLEQLRSRFEGKTIGASLTVSDEASWWYYHEFGTATHSGDKEVELPPSVVMQEPEGTFNSGGYPILPLNGEGIRLPITGGHPTATLVPMVGGEFTIEHPGVPATGMVREVLQDIHNLAVSSIGTSLHEGDYKPQSVQESLESQVMPKALDLIVNSIADNLKADTDRDTPGKLAGQSPADVFRGAATITPIEE